MRILSYKHEGLEIVGLLIDGHVVSLADATTLCGKRSLAFSSIQSLLEAGPAALSGIEEVAFETAKRRSQVGSVPLKSVRLCPPIAHPSKIVAIGLNYIDHAAEANLKLPTEPLLFAKFPSSITGPRDPILMPDGDPKVDFEVELAVVIGRRAYRVDVHRAMHHVAGYMVLNDVSARGFQFGDKQWTRGKSCDTFCPLGPWLTTPAEIPDVHALQVTTRVNGDLFQDANTRDLIFKVPELIAHISRNITLLPGDIIATGTPVGVGVFRDPPRFLRPGDVLETEVEGLGVLRNEVVDKLPAKAEFA